MKAGQPRTLLAAALVTLTTLGPAVAQTPQELYAEGVKARLEKRFDEAVLLLQRVVVVQPANADAWVQLGFAQLALGDADASGVAFAKALEIAPNYSDAKFGLAQIAFRSGRLDEALAIAEPLAREQPNNTEFAALLVSIRKAQEALRQGPPKAPFAAPRAAPKTVARVTRIDPVERLMSEGRKLRIAGRHVEAERTYLAALRHSPRNVDALVALGLVTGAQQKFDEAASYFDRALTIQPGSLDARLSKARLAIWTGDIVRARNSIDAIVSDHPRNMEARLIAARVSLLERDYERAMSEFTAIASEEPNNVEALVGIGDVRLARGDHAGAMMVFRRALQIAPGTRDIEQRMLTQPPKKWRFDIGSEVSSLSAGRGSWTDSSIGLSYHYTPDTSIGVRTRLATRADLTDAQIETRIEHAFSLSVVRVFGTTGGVS